MKAARRLRGLVIRGSRNVFTVNLDGEELECSLKGKTLKGAGAFYNPLAPGDYVEAEREGSGRGLITALEERRNFFARFNQKGLAPQLLAANVDLAVCLGTPASPPFRPRFLDRLVLQADIAGIPPLILINKIDLDQEDPDFYERLEDYRRTGYEVLLCSAKTGAGIEELKERLAGKTSVFAGQSGAGKSSVINALVPGFRARVGALNRKYDRGNHTTAQGTLLAAPGLAGARVIDTLRVIDTHRVIDTPGVRRFVPWGASPEDLILHMREFAPLAGKCSFGLSCSHETEPGCKILEAVAAGAIHEDRYESFLRIREDLKGIRGI